MCAKKICCQESTTENIIIIQISQETKPTDLKQ